jgi:aldose 1-epimerase
MPIQIKNTQFDDCFVTQDSKVVFTTPDYNLILESDALNNYLQIYTPKDSHKTALEFMSGVSNSFNNKIGLQELMPNEVYSTSFILNTNTNTK